VATLLAGLVLLGLAPFDTADTSPGVEWVIVIGLDLLLCALAILKGRLLFGLIGVFIPFVSLVGAIRLAAPTSPWARWRYREGSRKLQRSTKRFGRAHARHRRLIDAIGGRPEIPDAGANVALAQPDQEEQR
jgi:hypothetical protein